MNGPGPDERAPAATALETPATIGPYRVLGSLGRGGMGEVLLAHDPRLDREVAIKRVRADADEAGRLRFRREARLAASLSHPAIVPVFDFVTQGDHQHLVMERIVGPSLARWLDTAPPFEDKLRAACEIAAGLAYAHGRGIVHRDLKTENVLLAAGPTGRFTAKIADFGLACRTSPFTSVANELDEETRLTREGALLGTYRSMAPEQVWGETADTRADLFSFGVLLYELFGNSSPFAASSPAETLRRLTQEQATPLAERAPGLPPALSRLVGRLLEKERDLRPQSAEEVQEQLEMLLRERHRETDETLLPTQEMSRVLSRLPASPPPGVAATPPPGSTVGALAGGGKRIALAGLALALFLVCALAAVMLYPFGGRRSGEPIYAAVLPPRFEGVAGTPSDEQQRLAFAVRSATLRQLGNLDGLSPKAFEEVDQAAAGGLREMAAAAGADEMLRPVIFCSGTDCHLRLERLRAGDGSTLASETSELSLEDLVLASRSVEIAARRLYADLEPRGEDPPIAAAQYSRLLEIRQELAQRPDSRRLEARLEDLRRLREETPALYEAAWLEAETAWRRFAETHQEDFRQRAREAMAAALAAAPGNLEVLLRSAWLATLDERPADAVAALAQVESLAPGDLRAVDQRALLLEKQGKLAAALELRREAVERRPSWIRYYNLAFAAYQLSRWDEAGQALDRLLAAAPHHGRALSLRARIELTGGDPVRAVERYETLLAENESLLDRANLATAHLLAGDGGSAAVEIEKAIAAAPSNPYFLLILADARDLEGRQAEAAALYRQVDQDLRRQEDWQSLSVRAQAQARLGHKQEAFALLQRATKEAPPDDRGMTMEAALIYTLLGDRTAALYNIRKMVDWGWGGWLRLAPFAVWQSDPEIAPLLPPAAQPGGQPAARGIDG